MFRRMIVLPVLFAAAAAAVAPPAWSQDKTKAGAAPKSDGIETDDGVTLNVRLYKAAREKNGSVVVLMHDYKADPNKGAWGDLAQKLSANGYHVVRFDFRGHGESKDVSRSFWDDPFNRQYITGANKSNPPKQLEFKSFKNNYFPALVNDLAAVRTLIDLKNDLNLCNASTIYLIGAGDMAALGTLFLASEWHRERKEPEGLLGVKPQVVTAGTGGIQGIDSAGKDYGGCVWLSPSYPNTIGKGTVQKLVSVFGRDARGSLRDETATLVVHGEKDSEGARNAKYYMDDVLVAGGRGANVPKLEFAYSRTVNGTNLKGADLLGKNDTLKTEDMILEFLNKMEEVRKNRTALPRKYTKPRYVRFDTFGVN